MEALTRRLILFFSVICVTFISITNANCISAPVIRTVYSGGVLFEGPHWSTVENALYWVDIAGQRLYRLDGQSGNITNREIGYGTPSFLITVKDNPGTLVVSVRSEVYLLRWDAPAGDAALRLLSALDVGQPDNNGNDAKADAKGRLWFGTLGKRVGDQVAEDKGTLYMIDQYNHVNPEIKIRPVSLSNGMAWTADKKSMFYNDSPTKNVDVLDYNIDTGEIGNRRHLFSFEANNIPGIPDGMTIDKDDNLWVACYGGGMVIKVDSRTGELLEKLNMPTTQVTSVMWGGPDLATLYVTSMRLGLSPEQLARQPAAGSLLAVEGIGSRGLPENQFVFPGAATY